MMADDRPYNHSRRQIQAPNFPINYGENGNPASVNYGSSYHFVFGFPGAYNVNFEGVRGCPASVPLQQPPQQTFGQTRTGGSHSNEPSGRQRIPQFSVPNFHGPSFGMPQSRNPTGSCPTFGNQWQGTPQQAFNSMYRPQSAPSGFPNGIIPPHFHSDSGFGNSDSMFPNNGFPNPFGCSNGTFTCPHAHTNNPPRFSRSGEYDEDDDSSTTSSQGSPHMRSPVQQGCTPNTTGQYH